MASTELVSVRIPTEEKKRWEMLALVQGFSSLSDYVRDVVSSYSDGLAKAWGPEKIQRVLDQRKQAELEQHAEKWRQLNSQLSATLARVDEGERAKPSRKTARPAARAKAPSHTDRPHRG